MAVDISELNLAAIPERTEDQDEQVTLLVLRKGAGTPNADPSMAVSAVEELKTLCESAGFDPAQSYIAEFGIDVDPGGATTIADLAAQAAADPSSIAGSPAAPAPAPTDGGDGSAPAPTDGDSSASPAGDSASA